MQLAVAGGSEFFTTVRCGKRFKLWNTMPTSQRTAMALRSSASKVPLTVMWPLSWPSSPLMQRIIVDLPEPEGPQTTNFSPWRRSD